MGVLQHSFLAALVLTCAEASALVSGWTGFAGSADAGSAVRPPRALLQLQEVSGVPVTGEPVPKRPLAIQFYSGFGTEDKNTSDYVQMLLPAAARILARSIRVRQPSATFEFGEAEDSQGNALPNDANGAEIDLLVGFGSGGTLCENRVSMATQVEDFDEVTRRPTRAYIFVCELWQDRQQDLTALTHELVHALGFTPTVFEDLDDSTDKPFSFFRRTGMGAALVSANVVQVVREHFACPSMDSATLEDDGSEASKNSHWNSKLFEGELMTATFDPKGVYVLTDLTLAVLHDSGWYDVVYGSAGFNAFGYHAGCVFVDGSYDAALLEPAASAYLCDGTSEGDDGARCTFDFTWSGPCMNNTQDDGFIRVRPSVKEPQCSDIPSQRCVGGRLMAERGWESCGNMVCSDDGSVLINNETCSGAATCPPNGIMCEDPGLLTCIDALNDCNGHGACRQGRCFCHVGFGGDDCSVEACMDTCPDGSTCPPTGFCGVPTCGEWSDGPADRGTPCHPALTAITPVPINLDFQSQEETGQGAPSVPTGKTGILQEAFVTPTEQSLEEAHSSESRKHPSAEASGSCMKPCVSEHLTCLFLVISLLWLL